MKFSRTPKNEPIPRRRLEPREDSIEAQSSQFRRNQTLSSFRRPATEEESHRHRLHHLADKRRRVGGIFLLVVAVSVALGVLLLQFIAQHSVVSASTAITRPLDAPRYEKTIGDYFGMHPVERLRFALNERGLLAFVQSKHPEVKDITLSNVTEVVHAQFALSFSEPIAGWQINNRQYYVDNQGVVFQENYFAAPKVQIVDDSGISPEQGSAVASDRLLSFVGRVTHVAGERGYKVTSVTLPVGTTRQLELRLEGVQPVVRVHIDRGVEEQVEDMDHALKYLAANGRGASYIDVRVAGKVVYK